MRIDLHHHHHGLPDDPPWWARKILANQEAIMATYAELTAAVTRNTDAKDSMLKAFEGVVQKLKDAQATGDPAVLAQAISDLDANSAGLAAGAVANTPAA